ncbi:Ig-like domain-containing protein, partial [Parasphingorhabdus flavimaris]|uniref:Ig-like domain-containing protein n=1 Tax=Parasphingorhabdus flavimaris TaxID=266812 RepID=UPI00300213D4
MVIPDGAVFIPQFVIDGVSVPPLNLAALLVGNEPQPAAGPPQSSGGNFADPVGDIGDPFELGDLLPPTALSFPEFEQDELFPFEPEDEEDELPAAIIVTPDNPTGATNASSSVDESGLPARGSEPEGTNASGNGETTVGSIIFNPGDGPAVVSINGVAITAVGQSFAGNFGTLTITSISNGSIGYTYTLDDNTSGDNTADQFAVSVVDADGDVANADLTISIIDDAPVAVMDTDSIAAGEYGPATGNVITDSEADGGADIQGADGALVAGVAAGDTGTVLVDAGTVGTTVNGLYGVLTLNGDGSYSYARNPDSPGGVQDIFTYTLQDGDGDTSVTTLTIDIADSPVTLTLPVSGDAGAVVDEEGLPARGAESPGSNEASDLETTAGTISYNAADGPATVTINGVAVTAIGQTFAGASGTLTITGIANGAVTYSYTLADNTSGDNISDDFAVVITDQDGDSASGTLSIAIIDDAPVAVMDTDSIAAGEYGPATGNVITDSEADGGADIQGADGALVAGVAAGDTG